LRYLYSKERSFKEKGKNLSYRFIILVHLSKDYKWTFLVHFQFLFWEIDLLVITDYFTRWVEAFPIRNFRIKPVAEILVNQVISRFGVPLELHTDQGRNFYFQLFFELSLLLEIKKIRTIPFYPQFTGKVERQRQIIMNYLSKFVSENQRDWDRWIDLCLLNYRSARHEAIKISPAEMCFRRELKLSLDLLRGTFPQKFEFVENNYVSQLRRKLDVIHEGVREQLDLRSQRVKVLYNSKARWLLFLQVLHQSLISCLQVTQ